MPEQTRQSISDSLESDIRMLPYMPFLLQDLWALGGSVDAILNAIDLLHLQPDGTGILDLGCGKGAVSVLIARRFGLRTTGIDAIPEFLHIAAEKAREYGVSHLCQFMQNDIIGFVKTGHRFDLVILASLGGVFGSFQVTADALRRQVRNDGYIIIDDGYLRKENRLERKGYSHYRNHDTTIRELCAYGDILVSEISTADFTERINAEYLQVIKRRGNELIDRTPGLRPLIEEYILLQEEECRVIAEHIDGALFLLQKKGT